RAEGVFQGMSVLVATSHGVVTLTGFVTSDAAKLLASEEAGKVAGVKTVLNDLTVKANTPAAAATAPSTRIAPPPPPPVQTLPRSLVLGQGTFIPVRVNEALSSKT